MSNMRIVSESSTAPIASEVFTPIGSSDTAALRIAQKGKVVHDSGAVASGAVINTGVLDVTGISQLLVVANNASATNTRALTLTLYLDDGSTAIASAVAVATVSTSATEIFAIGFGATATNVSGGATLTGAVSMPLPTKIAFSLATAGSSNGRVTIYGR